MFKNKVKPDYTFYKIVADGGMAHPLIGEGRMIPAVVIDVETNVGINELIRLHLEGTQPGDTKLHWFLPNTFFSPKSVFLSLEFSRPMEVSFGIEFELSRHSNLIDGIIHSRAFYLISGKVGDKVSKQIGNGILVEVPNMSFDKRWNELFKIALKKKYKLRGASKKEANKYVDEHIKSIRDVWNLRRD